MRIFDAGEYLLVHRSHRGKAKPCLVMVLRSDADIVRIRVLAVQLPDEETEELVWQRTEISADEIYVLTVGNQYDTIIITEVYAAQLVEMPPLEFRSWSTGKPVGRLR